MNKYLVMNDPLDAAAVLCVVDANGRRIPCDPLNADYCDYLAWVAEGNTADQWQPDTPTADESTASDVD